MQQRKPSSHRSSHSSDAVRASIPDPSTSVGPAEVSANTPTLESPFETVSSSAWPLHPKATLGASRRGQRVLLSAREWAPIPLDASARYFPLRLEPEPHVLLSELGTFERPPTQLNFSLAARHACKTCGTSCYVITGSVL